LQLDVRIDWGILPVNQVYKTNTERIANVVKLCQKNGVKALVYTSALDTIYSGKPIINADGTYPCRHIL
jgi:nucleoside-diphosphate-sugar epimerase